MTGQRRTLSFLRSNLVVLVLLNSSNAANYLFQIILGRGLEPAQYGAFNSMASLAVLYGGLVLVVPMLLSRYTAVFNIGEPGRVNTLLRLGILVTVLLGLGSMAVGWAVSPYLMGLLHLDSRLAFGLLLLHMALIPLVQVPLGVMQGLAKFTAYGICGFATGVTYCLVAGVLVWFLGYGVPGAMSSYVLGSTVSILLGLYFLRDRIGRSGESLPRGFIAGGAVYSLKLAAAMALVQAMVNADIVLVRHFCQPEASGLYSTAAIIARIAFYLPLVLTNVLFPEVAKAQAEGRDDRGVVLTSLGLTALLSFGFAVVCMVASVFVVEILYGESYRQASGLLRILAPALAMLSVVNVLFTHMMARSRFVFVWILGGGFILFILMALHRHDNPYEIAYSLLFAISCILTSMLVLYMVQWRSRKNRQIGTSDA